jgi:hypothetical protein
MDAGTRVRAVARAAAARGETRLPPPVAHALTIVAAILAGDALAFGRLVGGDGAGCWDGPPVQAWRVRALASAAVAPRARARALATLAAAYRSLPASAAARLAGLGDGELGEGVAAAAGGGAAWAAGGEGGGELKFRG